jgi:hypothetical protein
MQGPPTSNLDRLRALRTHLSESLFPATPGSEQTLGRLEGLVLVVALLAIGTILALLRLGFSDSLNTVWAEDGPIYLQLSLTHGFWDAVFSPYAGYLVFVPRLIAEVATLVPLRYAAATVAIVSALVAALSGLAVWCATGGLIRNPYLRGGLALATLLGPAAGMETLNSAAYAPWYMLFATFWLLLWRPRTTWGAVLTGLFILATGLSTPGVWFFIPLAALRAISISDRRDATIVGSFAIGALVQVPVVLGQEQGVALWTEKIWTAYLQRVIDGGLFGQRLGGNLWAHLGWPFLIALLALVVVGIGVGVWRSTPGARWFAAVAIPTSLVMFVVSAYQRTVGPNLFWSAGSSGGTASRYVLVPALLLVSAGVVLIDAAIRRRRGSSAGLSWAVGATVAVLLLAIVTSFDMRDSASRGAPYWEDALTGAANKCVANGEELAGIPTAPAPFGVQLPCGEVASLADSSVTAPPASRANSGP